MSGAGRTVSSREGRDAMLAEPRAHGTRDAVRVAERHAPVRSTRLPDGSAREHACDRAIHDIDPSHAVGPRQRQSLDALIPGGDSEARAVLVGWDRVRVAPPGERRLEAKAALASLRGLRSTLQALADEGDE